VEGQATPPEEECFDGRLQALCRPLLLRVPQGRGAVTLNPASTKLVSPPELPSEPAGRALSAKEVRYLLSGPDREKPEGARDYALMLVVLRLSLRVSEVCSLRASSVKWSHGRWTLRCKVKGGREEVWPLPKDVKEAIDNYLRLDRKRREIAHSGGEHAHLFQPALPNRTEAVLDIVPT
jgi:integrase